MSVHVWAYMCLIPHVSISLDALDYLLLCSCLTTEVLEEKPFTETLVDEKAKAQQGSMLSSW